MLVTVCAAGCNQTWEQGNHLWNRNNFEVSAGMEQSAENSGKSRGGRRNGQCCSATWCWSPSLTGHHGHQPSQCVPYPWVKPGTERLSSSNLRLLHVTIKMFFNPLSLLILINIILFCTGQCWWLNLVPEHGDYWLQGATTSQPFFAIYRYYFHPYCQSLKSVKYVHVWYV